MKQIGRKPDVINYNSMIGGFCKKDKDCDAAFEALNEMVKQGCMPDVVSYNTILAALCEAGRWRDANELFDDMPRKGCCPDVVSYRTFFKGLCDAREFRKANMVLDEMVFKEHKPDAMSMCKFLEGLLTEDRNWSRVSSLVKVTTMGSVLWEKMVGNVLVESEALKVGEIFDCLTVTLRYNYPSN